MGSRLGWSHHAHPITTEAVTDLECPAFPSTLPKVGLKSVSIISGHHLHSQQKDELSAEFPPTMKIFPVSVFVVLNMDQA